MKKVLIFVVLLCFLAGCGEKEVPAVTTAETIPSNQIIGICLPDEADPYWAQCGAFLQEDLAALGWQAELCYAENDVLVQAQQIQSFYEQKVSCLVLACIDSVGLEDALADYRQAGIPVVALDRLVMDADGVAACVSYDYYAIGQNMAHHVETELSLATAQQTGRSHSVEFFMGSPDDPNAHALHQGILSVLQPYLGSGVLTCPSGRISFEDTWVLREDGEKAGENLRRYIEKYYEDGTFPQIICAVSDPVAQGCIQALTELGCPVSQWPLITGQGWQTGEVEANHQAMSVRKDLRQLSADCVTAVRMLVTNGQLDEGFAQSSADNHAATVPVRLCGFDVLVHSQEQIGGEEPQDPMQ